MDVVGLEKHAKFVLRPIMRVSRFFLIFFATDTSLCQLDIPRFEGREELTRSARQIIVRACAFI